jgi:2-hydroxycyclohexanecarboxyl-CoA dehydrogenase
MIFILNKQEYWERIIRINFARILNCATKVLEPMSTKGHGIIDPISSDNSRQGEPREAVCGGMKVVINGFMKLVTKENDRFCIRYNVV